MEVNQDKAFSLNLTAGEIQIILGGLSEVPTKFGMPLTQKLIGQMETQLVNEKEGDNNG